MRGKSKGNEVMLMMSTVPKVTMPWLKMDYRVVTVSSRPTKPCQKSVLLSSVTTLTLF